MTFNTNIRNEGDVNFDVTRLHKQWWMRGVSPGFLRFYLIDSSSNIERMTLLHFPWWTSRTHFCQIWRGGWAFPTPSISALEVSQAVSPTEATDPRRARLTSVCPSFCCCCSSDMLSKVTWSCYGRCPTLGRMPRGCGPPPGSPQEAGPESAESLCTRAPALRCFLHRIHFQGALVQMSTVWHPRHLGKCFVSLFVTIRKKVRWRLSNWNWMKVVEIRNGI